MIFIKQNRTFLLVCLLYAAALLYINPIREVMIDDDWAFARTFEHFEATGNYRLDDFLAPNSPALIYWGAAFTAVLGSSYATLRVSMLAAQLMGMVFFYQLAKAYRFDNTSAALLTLVLLSSPALFRFSFYYLSDVLFLPLMIGALLFYTWALQRHAWGWALIGSVVAGAAILTRQTGIALLVGIGFCWLFDSKRFRLIPFYAVMAAIPAVAALWQAFISAANFNWAMGFVKQAQIEFFTQPILTLLDELLFRVAAAPLSLAFFITPLFILLVFYLRQQLKDRTSKQRMIRWVIASQVLVLLIILAGRIRTGMTLMPYLPSNYAYVTAPGRFGITFLTMIGGMLTLPIFISRFWDYGQAMVRRLLSKSSESSIAFFDETALPSRLAEGTVLALVVLTLAFFQIYEKYLLVFLPFVLLLFGKVLNAQIMAHGRLLFRVSIVALVLSAISVRSDLALEEAKWLLNERLLAQGIPVEDISGQFPWNLYHGQFSAYLSRAGDSASYSAFFGWIGELDATSPYRVTNDPKPSDGEIIDQIAYRDEFFVERMVYALQRQSR